MQIFIFLIFLSRLFKIKFFDCSHKTDTERYDKHLEHRDQTPLGKLQQQYWTTKQKILKKLGKEEDEYVVLSDSELDAKLDVRHSKIV